MPKAQIYIKNLSIKNIPTRSNRIFVKIKSGQKSIYSSKHQINQTNSVDFEIMLTIQSSVKKTNKGCFLERLRFSFRIEKSDGIDFTRYGSFNVNDINFEHAKKHSIKISRSLEKCKEKPKIECEIIVVDHSKSSFLEAAKSVEENNNSTLREQSQPVFSKNSLETAVGDFSSKTEPCNNKKNKNDQVILNINKSRNSINVSSFSLSVSSSKSIPLVITEQKYIEIEQRIDDLLANIING